MPSFLDVFASEGTPREVAGNTPLPLDDPDTVWLLVSGALEVFVVGPSTNDVTGTRVRLCRIKSGQLLFCLKPTTGSVLAVGGPGTQVRGMCRERFMVLLQLQEQQEQLVGLLNGWIRALTAGIARHRAPRRTTLVEPSGQVALTSNSAASPAKGTVWVRHERGSSWFLGKAELHLKADALLFPLSSAGWLVAEEADTQLVASSTETVLSDGNFWPALERFHRIILDCLALNVGEAGIAERSRVLRREQAEQQLLHTTLKRFSDIDQPGEADDLSETNGSEAALDDNPLLAACRLVGARLGIPIKAPLGSSQRKTWSDSLSASAQSSILHGMPLPPPKKRSDPVSAIARSSRVRVRRVLLSGDWCRQDNGPLLAFLAGDERPVALLPTSPTRYELVDPTAEKGVPVTAATAAALVPMAFKFYRSLPTQKLTPWNLFRFGVLGSRRDWLLVFLLGLAGSLLGMFTPYVTGIIFDRIIPGAERSHLLLVVSALLVIGIASVLFQFTQGIASLRLETKIDAAVQAGVWDRLLNLPAPFFRSYTAGDLAQRAMGINAMRQILTDFVLSAVLSFVFSLAYFGLLFYYDARLALVACLLFLVVLVTTGLAALKQLSYQRKIYQVRGRIAGLVLQLITGITRLRLAGAEERALSVWAREFRTQKKLAFRARSAANRLTAFNAAIPVLSSLVLFATVVLLPRQGLSLGAFLAFSVAFVQILYAALQIGSILSYAVQLVPLYERAKPILHAAPEVDDAKAIPSDLSGDIELTHVSFRYKPDGPLILDDVSLHIPAGDFVAFVGPSGAGKSTIIRLLLGFEAPSAGSIYYDSEDVAGLDLQEVRRQIGVVLQDGKVMAGDIFSNIIGSALLTLDDAWEAARLSGLDEDIDEMPMGMQTVISEGGGTLSGGQRQRLMIARAVVSKPRILMLDEATSALDNQTQAQVSESLERLKATRIVVAHRLSTIRYADCIYVLDGGRIVQRGSYEELIQQPGLFAELAQRQLV